MKKVLFIVLISLSLTLYFVARASQEIAILPVSFSSSLTPFTPVKVGKTERWLLIDLGMSAELELSEEILSEIPTKQNKDISIFEDFFGNVYESPSYLLRSVSLKRVKFENVLANKRGKNFHKNTTFNVDLSEKLKTQLYGDLIPKTDPKLSSHNGRLGNHLLRRVNLLLDFPKKRIFCCNRQIANPHKLKGYEYLTFSKVPFTFVDRLGIVIEIETDFGKGHFIVDTGCSFSAARPSFLGLTPNSESSHLITQTCLIQGVNFPPQSLFPMNIAEDLTEIDGFIGMDFLNKHVIFIDFVNKFLYIEKNF